MAKGEINLPEVKIEAPIPEGTINLPEVKVSANPAPPVGHINVLSPDGKLGHVPIEWLIKEGNNKGYTIPSNKSEGPTSSDLTKDGQIKVVRKSDGQGGLVPLKWFESDPNAKNYVPESMADIPSLQEHKKLVDDNLRLMSQAKEEKNPDLIKNLGGTKEEVQDSSGNYKLTAPSGESVLVNQKHLQPLLSSGFKFQSPAFQALYEANLQLGQGKDLNKKDVEVGASSYVGSLPGFDWLRDKMTSSSDSMFGKAWNIANRQLEHTTQATAHKVGTGLGIAAQVLTPGGIFGEAKAAQALGAATAAKLAPEGASLLRQVAARGAAGALEGMVITSPQVLAHAALEDNPKLAAESLGLGAGLGMFLGAGGKLISGGLERGIQGGMKLADKATELARPSAVDAALTRAGASAESLEKLGTVEARETFLRSLVDKGISGKSKGEEVGKALQELGQGEKFSSTLNKLEKTAEPLSASNLTTQIAKASDELASINPQMSASVTGVAERFNKLVDSSGNVTMDNLQKFVKELGGEINWKKIESLDNIAKTKIYQSGLDELMMAGDKAALKADAKLAAEWATNKSVAEISNQMHQKLMQDIMTSGDLALSPIAEFIKKSVSSKITGAVGGSLIGGPIGAMAGGIANAAVVKPAIQGLEERFINHYVNNPANASKLTGWLLKNKSSSAIGSYLTLDAVHATAQKTKAVTEFMENLGAKTSPTRDYLSAISEKGVGLKDPIKSILGDEANGLTKAQQFKRLSDRAASMSSSPELRQQYYNDYIAPVLKDHPVLAQQMMLDMDNKLQFINTILHGNNTAAPQPFAKKKDYQPSKSEMKEIEDQLRIAMNPYALITGLEDGSITPKQVAVASKLNPAILAHIRDEMTRIAFSGKVNLDHQQRLRMSILMGEAMDQSLKQVSNIQQSFATQPQQAGPKGQSGSKIKAADLPASQGTLSQRLMGK